MKGKTQEEGWFLSWKVGSGGEAAPSRGSDKAHVAQNIVRRSLNVTS